MKISQRKIKKAERDITIIVNDLLKPYRGLLGVTPSIKISFHRSNEGAEILYPNFDGKYMASGSVKWKTIESESGKLEITVFKP